ncbi:MAG: hypothetical protein GF347_03865 [Candidatus Moranbacteria bacterium]|nr:hypothetical protein [Candidatus Moranbacteria bacterium]
MKQKAEIKNRREKGITMLEIILVVALITLLAAVTSPVYVAYYTRNNLHLTAATIASGLRKAQTKSRAMQNDNPWSLYIEEGKIVIYEGSDYASRNSGFDEIYEIPDSISFSGDLDLNFSKLEGELNSNKNLSLINPDGKTMTMVINTKGTIEY